MPAVGLTTWIWENNFKTTFLVLLFPVLLFATLFLILFLVFWFDPDTVQALETTAMALTIQYFELIVLIGLPVLLLWFFISLWFHRQIVFSMAGAKPITRKEMPDIYNIVENLCISRGLPVPQIGIMEDSSMNAFATGWNPEKSWIVFSRGLLDRLDKKEIKAVAAHELTHIMNRDVRLMTILAVFIGILGSLGYILLRFNFSGGNRRGSGKGNGKMALIVILIGLVLYIFSILIFPIIRLAISRKREFMADAGSVELTKDNQALISALEKISTDSVIEKMKNPTLSAMCIEPPKASATRNWFSSHPPLTERINVLRTLG